MLKPFTAVSALFLLCGTGKAPAASYTYVDANLSNTTVNGAPAVHGTNIVADGTPGSTSDNLWTFRTDSSVAAYEASSCFESDSGVVPGDGEDTAALITTVNIPAAGTYEFVVVFARNNGRDIAAKIGASPMVGNLFSDSNYLTVNQTSSPQVAFDGSYGNGRGANHGAGYLGTVTTTANNQAVRIYINGFSSNTAGIDQRTQYEGIGWRAVSDPPPRSAPKHRDVFIIAGQSNADGRGLKADLTGGLSGYAGQQTGVQIHYTNTAYTNSNKSRYKTWMPLEPGYSVAPGYSGALPSLTFGQEIGAAKILSTRYANPAFIKVTRGGTALGVPGTDWFPARLNSPDVGPLYQALISSTLQALAEIRAAGDTYTVRGLFWHQGESDSGRTGTYANLLTTLFEGIRRDLGLPNLRMIVGELADTKPQAFRDVQWQVTRTLANASFISTRALATSDDTHFTAASMVTFGERLGYALLPDRNVLDFEMPIYAVGRLDRQDELAAATGLASALQVVTTGSQGDYVGGRAAGHKGASGAFFFSRRHFLPLSGARTMQADFFPGDAGFDNQSDTNSSLLVAGWAADAGNDGAFASAETAMGFGVNDDGKFSIQIGNTVHLTTAFSYQIDRWYRLTLTWSEPDSSGKRTVALYARDLASRSNLNSGAPILSLDVASADFDGNPATWAGLGSRATRGLIDNIRGVTPGFASLANAIYPHLTGGLTEDDDGDGIPNAVEFAFGLNPLLPNSANQLPQPVFGATSAKLSFSALAAQPGIIYGAVWSRDLVSWNTAVGNRSGNTLDFTIPTGGEQRIFIRHRVVIGD